MVTQKDPADLFRRWFKEPINQLSKIPNGDGYWIVLLTCCALYERYVTGSLKPKYEHASRSQICGKLEKDFKLGPKEAEIFWIHFRHGLAHTGLPFIEGEKPGSDKYLWFTDESVPNAIQVDVPNKKITFNPRLIMEEIMGLCEKYASKLDLTRSIFGEIRTPNGTSVTSSNAGTSGTGCSTTKP